MSWTRLILSGLGLAVGVGCLLGAVVGAAVLIAHGEWVDPTEGVEL